MLWTENEATVQGNNNNKSSFTTEKGRWKTNSVLKDNSKKYPLPREIGHRPMAGIEGRSLPSPQRWREA